MIDTIKPDQIATAIQKYKTGGLLQAGGMPEDVRSELNEFQTMLAGDATEADKVFFQKAIDSILTKYPVLEATDQIDKEDNSIDLLMGGNWFKRNPDKLLGTPTAAKDRYGKEIQTLAGDISVLDQIHIDGDLMQLAKGVNIAVSDSKEPIEIEILKPENTDFAKQIIDKSNVSIGKKSVTKKKKEQSLDEDLGGPVLNLRTYKEVYSSLNNSISTEELRAYIWYKDRIGQRLSDQWYDIAYSMDCYGSEPTIKSYHVVSEDQVRDWVENGVLFYFDGELWPLPIYASGDVYKKISRLVKGGDNSGQDAEHIEATYGPEVVKNHLEVLNAAFQKVYKNRLIITGNDDANSLILKPTSKFAKSVKISNMNSMEEFKWWKVGRKDNFGTPDFAKRDGSDYKKDTFESLTLTEAYQLWLVTNRFKLDIKGNITVDDIIYFHIEKRVRQAPAGADDFEKARFHAQMERTKAKAASEGNRLFLVFLNEELSLEQKVMVETQWNSQFNNYLQPDFDKIPVAFNVTNNFFGEEPFEVKAEKREAVAYLFNEGSGTFAFDVGVGKSISAIMSIEQFIVAGYAKRPFLVVPNQTYKQWLSEIKNAMPNRKVNGLFNLGVDYIHEVLGEDGKVQMVDEGSISVMTYEGFQKLGFSDSTASELLDTLYDILNQGGQEEQSDKKRGSFREKLEKLIGRGLKGTNVQIEDLGFDFVCFDEAHALKKVFTTIKGEQQEGDKKAKKQYSVNSGTPSDTALKGFMIANYILTRNNNRNILLLTATPFTNSPLEVFSMLSLVAYHHLDKLGLKNINDFFDNYIDVNSELVINHKLQPQYKQVVKGFNNLPSLQKIIFRFFNYKDGEDVGVIRPNKIVIPYMKKLVDGNIVDLPVGEQVTCNLEMSPIQKRLMDEVVSYAEGKGELGENIGTFEDIDDEGGLSDSDSSVLSEAALTNDDKAGVRALRAMNFSRNIALSPYLYEYSGLKAPTASEYINTSPKLNYVMQCIKSVKLYHEEHNEPVSGQVVYMDRGLKYFSLLREYLIETVGFKSHEVAEITSKMSSDKKREVQDAFLGRKYNELIKDYEPISDEQRVKVLLGSSSIKEGMNLQTKSTVLYNCFLDWNPTDIIQLQGRIWRQKNEFLNVRIVNPLVIDSIDIFMFQKLEEKTARINTIWSNNGKSVFKLEEIDPSEIKFALVKDPKVLAGLEVETKVVTLQDEKNSIKSINDRLLEYNSAVKIMEYKQKDIDELIRKFAPSKLELELIPKINFLNQFYKADRPKDEEGRYILDDYTKKYNLSDFKKEFPDGVVSPIEKGYEPYWLKGLIANKRLIEKENRDLLAPRNIKPDEVEMYIKDSGAKSEDIDKKIEHLKSETYIEERVKEILAMREKNKFVLKDIKTLVGEFGTLNYLLSLKRMKQAPKPKVLGITDSPELRDENGNKRYDEEAIDFLGNYVENMPDTKSMNVNENGEYTEERTQLHLKIINDLKKNISCIAKDQPIAILTGGSPASGKSTFLKTYAPYFEANDIFKIDADGVREMLPEYRGWNSTATHMETKDIVNTLISDKVIGVPCNFDMIYDGTMNSAKNYLPLIGTLKRLGYRVFIIYIDNVPYSITKERMIGRYRRGDERNGKGRFVPLSVLQDFYSKGKTALDMLKDKVDGYMVVDGMDNYKIIEQGGLSLPHERDYNEIGMKPALTNLEEARDQSSSKAETQQAIELLQELLPLQKGKDKKETLQAIELLKELLELS